MCHELCETCDADGVTECLTCKHYWQDGRCVESCRLDYFIAPADPPTCHACHSHCVQCRGPTAAECVKCKYYTIYSDLSIGVQDPEEEGGDIRPLAVSGACLFLSVRSV